jgi:hypothetical protein
MVWSHSDLRLAHANVLQYLDTQGGLRVQDLAVRAIGAAAGPDRGSGSSGES